MRVVPPDHSATMANTRRLSIRHMLPALAGTLLASGAAAWDGHDLLRRVALEDMTALAGAAPVPVTPLAVEIPGVNPAAKFEFKTKQPGETEAPLDILVTYAMEPDWGMDQNMKVSWQQKFMGGYEGLGSQGYFHMYYPAMTIHLPMPVASMGAAPKRAAGWMQMARAAFQRGEAYWGWRFTAWALHYVEDLGQPYHSTQTHRRFIRKGSLIGGTTNCTANFHLLYEDWLAHRLADEVGGGRDFGLRAALKAAAPMEDATDLKVVVKTVAKASHKVFGKLVPDCIAYFGEKFVSDDKVAPTPEDLEKVVDGPELERIMAASRYCYKVTGAALRGVVAGVLASQGGAAQPPIAD